MYKVFFALGLRDSIPLLIFKAVTCFKLSPGQFTPPAWKVLVCIQVLGEIYSIDSGVDEVLCAYYLRPLLIDADTYSIYPRYHSSLVLQLEGFEKRNIVL